MNPGRSPRPAARTAAPPADVIASPATPAPPSPAASGRVDQLAFLHEFAQLLTEARDWDALMRTLVDRTTAALGVEVCSFYLLDRDGVRLTLAATNGLDAERGGMLDNLSNIWYALSRRIKIWLPSMSGSLRMIWPDI